MKDKIFRRLEGMPVPPPSDAAKSRARHRALVAFTAAVSSPAPVEKVSSWKWAVTAVALGSACLLALALWPHAAAESLANDRQILRQMETLFPRQVDSVVEQNGKIDLTVAPSTVVGSQQPILMVFRKDGHSIHVLSYSGHHVCVPLGDGDHCFDILATPGGSVILEGSDDVWVTSRPVVVAGYTVQAQALETSASL